MDVLPHRNNDDVYGTSNFVLSRFLDTKGERRSTMSLRRLGRTFVAMTNAALCLGLLTQWLLGHSALGHTRVLEGVLYALGATWAIRDVIKSRRDRRGNRRAGEMVRQPV